MITNAREWKARWTSAFPAQAMTATLTAALLSWTTMLVLSLSDGKILGSWIISPSVIIAILSTCANALLRFAFSEGAVLSWWSLALRGASVQDLHRTWTFSDSFLAALTSGSTVSTLLRVASLAVTLLVVDGPLLQKSSTIGQSEKIITTKLTLPIRTYPLWNYTIRDVGDSETYFQPEFNEIVSQYYGRRDIGLPPNICTGKCNATVTIGGFDRNCTSSRLDVRNVSTSFQFLGAMVQIGWRDGKNDYNKTLMPIFQMDTNVMDDHIQLFSVLRDSNIGSNVLVRTCLLKPALISLDVEITNTTLTFRRTSLTENRTIEMTGIGKLYSNFILNGFSRVLEDQYGSGVGKNPEDGIDTTGPEYFYGVAAHTYLNQTDLDEYIKLADGGFNPFNRTWIDPLPDYFNSLDEMSLRYAMKVIPETPTRLQEYMFGIPNNHRNFDPPSFPKPATSIQLKNEQTVTASQITSVVVYRTNKNFLAMALIVMLLATSSVGSTLLGWRHLGRKFTFSPLEVAKAFDAQLLVNAGSNMTITEILDVTRGEKICYGVHREKSDGFHTANHVTVPANKTYSASTILGYTLTSRNEGCKRLLMLHEVDAEKPRKGELYY